MRPAIFLALLLAALTGCDILDPNSGVTRGQLAHDLRIGATYRVERMDGIDVVVAALTVVNAGFHTIDGTTGQNPVWLVAYADSTRRGPPVWSMQQCCGGGPDLARILTLAPGDTLRLDAGSFPPIPVAELLGSRQAGTVWFTAWLDRTAPDEDSPELPAGSVELVQGAE